MSGIERNQAIADLEEIGSISEVNHFGSVVVVGRGPS
jgi:hypothetical protein